LAENFAYNITFYFSGQRLFRYSIKAFEFVDESRIEGVGQRGKTLLGITQTGAQKGLSPQEPKGIDKKIKIYILSFNLIFSYLKNRQ